MVRQSRRQNKNRRKNLCKRNPGGTTKTEHVWSERNMGEKPLTINKKKKKATGTFKSVHRKKVKAGISERGRRTGGGKKKEDWKMFSPW